MDAVADLRERLIRGFLEEHRGAHVVNDRTGESDWGQEQLVLRFLEAMQTAPVYWVSDTALPSLETRTVSINTSRTIGPVSLLTTSGLVLWGREPAWWLWYGDDRGVRLAFPHIDFETEPVVGLPELWAWGESIERWLAKKREHRDLEVSNDEAAAKRAMAFWDFIQEFLPQQSSVSRAAARRGLRLDAPISLVNTVTLRRRKPNPFTEEGGLRLYSHRWMVREHWRNQACGPGRKDHRLVKIEAHPAGPAHLPLIEKETRFRVVR